MLSSSFIAPQRHAALLGLWLSLAWFLAGSLPCAAHQVPNLTLETEFSPDGAVEFRLNLDPRLFLAEDPTTLPPVPAAWFRDQSTEEKNLTLANARAFVRAAITFFFDDQPVTDPLTWELTPIDGATGLPFTDETAEIHFVAICKTRRPPAAQTSSLRLEAAAKAPTVLLNSLHQQAERQPQILFPGETSRPFRCAPDSPPAASTAPASSK